MDRAWACYLHASLKYIQNEFMTDTTLREHFGIEAKNSILISRIIKEALDKKLIYIFDENVGAKARSYIPWWVK